ncbi:hypothetical protein NG799_01655 [Laspinema sp. D1]|uniref:Uncharacterized protein n=2 Tax=Laspinema TaxID=2584823 RepID=A0ABT2MJX0_9CYAN|nr:MULTISPECIES: hypothetical protein [unclassified Laspinema]MCT7965036.1 hypothetical protein [Laspinema sp. D2a]MCT7977679.1 hypothetical protein [Laspinema sp. D3b]MCT7992524.1 hypothetical protein [Laspinema sp. D3c]
MQRIVEKVKVVSIPKWVDQAIDIKAIATRLQAVGIMECQCVPTETVEYAVSEWFKAIVDSIESDPEWFINKFNQEKFRKHIPYPDELEIPEVDDMEIPLTV